MDDYDLYDVLADLGYGLDPKTRIQRADPFFHKHAAWLAGLPAMAASPLEAIVTQFGTAGTDGLESPDIFNLPEVRKAGGRDGPIKALRKLGKPANVLLDTKATLSSRPNGNRQPAARCRVCPCAVSCRSSGSG